jgi:hypothetical protein
MYQNQGAKHALFLLQLNFELSLSVSFFPFPFLSTSILQEAKATKEERQNTISPTPHQQNQWNQFRQLPGQQENQWCRLALPLRIVSPCKNLV